MKTSTEIRKAFLDYFASKGHTVVPSSSLVPANDPTLLFTNAGMVQFKDIFTGVEKREYSRATTAQKCMRVSGKHNDLENVGPSPRHHTFFEMLGNFSFGDYFKREAIAYAWECLTQVYGLSPDRLYATIYEQDDEAAALWQEVAHLSPERITRMGKDSNFWAMGDTGPNGPCSEIIYDRGKQYCTCGRPDCSPAHDCERWWELWNLVFMQYETLPDGTTRDLPKPSIDTGMGMERLTAILQGADSNYDTDLFLPIMDRVQELLGDSDAERARKYVSYRVIADHARATAFLIADGVLPGNEGRNYVLRLILRRAARHGKMIGFEGPFMAKVIEPVIEVMGSHYTELVKAREFILEAVTQEEERFLQTLSVGLTLLDETIAEVKAAGGRTIPGPTAFRLYDTYGFPLDLTRDVAKEHGLTVDEAGYQAALEEQRARARAAQQFAAAEEAERYRGMGLPPTLFSGYETLEDQGVVLALVVEGRPVEQASAGQRVEVVLDKTPFYAEAGGQVGDTGVLESPSGRVVVEDTRRPLPDVTVHYGHVADGTIRTGEQVTAKVDRERRLDIARNHTATHLLHRALRTVLGDHARQAGSLVAPDRLRFDFTHLRPVTPEQLRAVEDIVNAAIRDNLPVIAQTMPYDQAIRAGAVALFGEKYGDVVRMVETSGFSRELCGGTHLRATGEIGAFYIVSESSIGSGLRRIEAVTGRGAQEYVRARLGILEKAATTLESTPDDLAQRVEALAQQWREAQREIADLRRQLSRFQARALLADVHKVGGIQVLAARVEAASMEGLRELSDYLRDQMGSGVIVLGAAIHDRPALVAVVTPDLVQRGLDATAIVRQVAKIVGGSGGGRPTLAQAGGHDLSRLDEALGRVEKIVGEAVGA
ncbi:MAG: alanine--tRNA ligase [Chloroflexi bacterium]|nr:alanine--tRNA ligase [Chloroflexota bacterium]